MWTSVYVNMINGWLVGWLVGFSFHPHTKQLYVFQLNNECSKLEQRELKTRHDCVGKVIN